MIHVDIDAAELGKVRRPDVAVAGDCRVVIEEMVRAMDAQADRPLVQDLAPWWKQINEWRERFPLYYEDVEGGAIKPQNVVEQLRDAAPEDTIVVAGVGQHQMWASQYWKFEHPYTWVNSGGAGTMGFAVPAAVGAKVGRPDRTVWAIDGDGCFQMTAQELVTASSEQIPVKIAILNNAYLGMVRQWQEMFYEERYSEVYLSPDLPDYVKWAEAMGCAAFRVEDNADVAAVGVDKANAIDEPTGGHRFPDRLAGKSLPDGGRRGVQPATSSSTLIAAAGWGKGGAVMSLHQYGHCHGRPRPAGRLRHQTIFR